MSKPKFPMTVKRGHTTVKIYRTPSRKCDAYTVVHYLGKRRQRKTFADLGLAVTEAETVANKLSTGEVNVLTLTSDDRLSSECWKRLASCMPRRFPNCFLTSESIAQNAKRKWY